MDRSARTSLQIQRDVIYALLLREMGSRFGKSRVGFLWVLLEPVAHLVFPVTLFGVVLQRTLPNMAVEYPVFLVYGFLPFLVFKTVCMQTMEGTKANQGLLSYRQVLLLDVFVAKTLASVAVEVIVFAVVVAGLAMAGYDVQPPRPIEFAATFALTVLLAFGLGLLFAGLTSMVPDARTVIRLLFVPLYFVSGILFPISRFPDAWVDWLAINPALHLVEMSRAAAVAHYVPMRQLDVEYVVGLMLAALFGGLALYRLRVLARVTA